MIKVKKILCHAVSRQAPGTPQIQHISTINAQNSTNLSFSVPKHIDQSNFPANPGTNYIKHISAFIDQNSTEFET